MNALLSRQICLLVERLVNTTPLLLAAVGPPYPGRQIASSSTTLYLLYPDNEKLFIEQHENILRHIDGLHEYLELRAQTFTIVFGDALNALDVQILAASDQDKIPKRSDVIYQAVHYRAPQRSISRHDKLPFDSDITTSWFLISMRSAIAKYHRGEWFEAIRRINQLRVGILGAALGRLPGHETSQELPHFEERYPEWIGGFSKTVAVYDKMSIRSALRACISLYSVFRVTRHDTAFKQEALNLLEEYLEHPQITGGCAPTAISTQHITASGFIPPAQMLAVISRLINAVEPTTYSEGVAIGGSWSVQQAAGASRPLDLYSDIDLFILCSDDVLPSAQEQTALAQKGGTVLALTPGRKRGQLTCLYRDALVLVDFNFVSIQGIANRYQNPIVAWERTNKFTQVLANTSAKSCYDFWDQRTIDWLQSSFWIALLECVRMLERGQLFAVLGELSRINAHILGPFAALRLQESARGVRHFEDRFPSEIGVMSGTSPPYDRAAIIISLVCCLRCFRAFQNRLPSHLRYLSPLESHVASKLAALSPCADIPAGSMKANAQELKI